MITVKFGVQVDDTDNNLSEILALTGGPTLTLVTDPEPSETEVGLLTSTGATITLRCDPEFGILDVTNLPNSLFNSVMTEFEIVSSSDVSIISMSNLAGTQVSEAGNFQTFLQNSKEEGIRLIGSKFSDTLHGGSLIDSLEGGNGNDRLFGMAGNDTLSGSAGNDTLNGAGGSDTASYNSAKTAVTVNLTLAGAQNTGGGGTDTFTGIENIFGTKFNDTLTGNAGNNVLTGGAGNDMLTGGAGSDTASYATAAAGVTVKLALTAVQNTGGAGRDTLSGIENLTGSKFNDTLNGTAGNNVLTGGAGNDTLNAGAGIDTASYDNAAAGVTVSLALTGTQDTVGAGTDTLKGVENLTGSGYADTLTGNEGNNVLSGGGGTDLLIGGAGNDTLNGGAEIDTVSYSAAAAGVTVNLTTAGAQNTGGAGTDTLVSIENIVGSNFNDVLTGKSATRLLNGGNGNDTLNGSSGSESILIGGAGDDTLIGGQFSTASYETSEVGVTIDLSVQTAQDTIGAGIDTLTGIANITGSDFDDTLSGDGGFNILDGGFGTDTVSFSNATSGVSVNLSLLTAQGTGGAGIVTLSGVENLTGSAFNDTLSGDQFDNVLVGGDGTDTISYSSGASGVTVDLSVTTGQNTVGEGTDTLTQFENITGSNFDDTLTGDAGDNVLMGGDGFGDDVLIGGAGNDTLNGGANFDTFVFTSTIGTDTLQDFYRVDDELAFDQDAFPLLGSPGTLSSSRFINSLETPAGGDDYLIYVADSGDLYYDATGVGLYGVNGGVLIAHLGADTLLDSSDIFVI